MKTNSVFQDWKRGCADPVVSLQDRDRSTCDGNIPRVLLYQGGPESSLAITRDPFYSFFLNFSKKLIGWAITVHKCDKMCFLLSLYKQNVFFNKFI